MVACIIQECQLRNLELFRVKGLNILAGNLSQCSLCPPAYLVIPQAIGIAEGFGILRLFDIDIVVLYSFHPSERAKTGMDAMAR